MGKKDTLESGGTLHVHRAAVLGGGCSTNEIANLDLWGYHDLKHNGCEGYYPASNELNASAFPAGAVVLRSNGLYYSSDWPTPFSFAFGRPYLCSDALRVRRYC